MSTCTFPRTNWSLSTFGLSIEPLSLQQCSPAPLKVKLPTKNAETDWLSWINKRRKSPDKEDLGWCNWGNLYIWMHNMLSKSANGNVTVVKTRLLRGYALPRHVMCFIAWKRVVDTVHALAKKPADQLTIPMWLLHDTRLFTLHVNESVRLLVKPPQRLMRRCRAIYCHKMSSLKADEIQKSTQTTNSKVNFQHVCEGCINILQKARLYRNKDDRYLHAAQKLLSSSSHTSKKALYEHWQISNTYAAMLSYSYFY